MRRKTYVYISGALLAALAFTVAAVGTASHRGQ